MKIRCIFGKHNFEYYSRGYKKCSGCGEVRAIGHNEMWFFCKTCPTMTKHEWSGTWGHLITLRLKCMKCGAIVDFQESIE